MNQYEKRGSKDWKYLYPVYNNNKRLYAPGVNVCNTLLCPTLYRVR
jgi:hypothetical protein